MKKVVSLLLALFLMVGLLSTAVFAEEGEDYDVISFEEVLSKKSDNGLFTLTSTGVDEDGWRGGGIHTLTITAAEGLTITRIEAEISSQCHYYGGVGVSGTAVKSNSPKKDGDIATVSDINSSEFSFVGGDYFVLFKNITVYYCTHSFDENGICKRCHYVDESKHEHIFDGNNVCACGVKGCDVKEHVLENGFCKFCEFFDESKHEQHIFDDENNCACGVKGCDIEEHVLENGFCKFCNFFDESKHEHIFDDNRNCACGATKCDVGEHVLENGFCEFCDFFDESKHTHDFTSGTSNGLCKCGAVCQHEEPITEVVSAEKKYCPDCGEALSLTEITDPEKTGSTLSQGNMTIVCSIATLALGLVGGLLLGKKKKPAAANGANSEDKE